jgi:general secretion pathway protein G
MNTAGTPARCHCNWNSLTSIGDVMAMLIRRNVSRGFTVMVLIGLLAPGIFARRPPYFAQVGKPQFKVARAQIDALGKALAQFRIDVGHAPTSEQGLRALVVQPSGEPNWAGPYLKKGVPADPWGRPYVYRQPGAHGDFDLFSYGNDGRSGGTGEDADITNW